MKRITCAALLFAACAALAAPRDQFVRFQKSYFIIKHTGPKQVQVLEVVCYCDRVMRAASEAKIKVQPPVENLVWEGKWAGKADDYTGMVLEALRKSGRGAE